jgi:simple sugar transport system ATP-binding protein
VAAHPTYGLDVGSAAHTHERLLAQRERGAAVLLISEDLEELCLLSDRVAVMFNGQIVGVLDAQEAGSATGRARLGLWMAGSVEA